MIGGLQQGSGFGQCSGCWGQSVESISLHPSLGNLTFRS